MRIKQVHIQNFKAFRECEILDFDSCNVLIYGNNGSGKSSIYYALHGFLQSSVKTEEQIQDYFDPANSESIINLYADPGSASFVRVFTDNGAKYTFAADGDTRENPTIQLANLASDFMNFRLLFRFFNVREAQDADIFPIFFMSSSLIG